MIVPTFLPVIRFITMLSIIQHLAIAMPNIMLCECNKQP